MREITWRELFREVRRMFKLNIFSKTKLLLAFEFAVVLSDTAHQMNIEMTKEIVLRGEELLENEMRHSSASTFACNMNVYALAVLEPKEV